MYDRSGQRKYLNKEERKKFLNEVRSENNIFRKAFCLTLFYTGCRISEALRLKWERIDFYEKMIVFETLKQRRKGSFRSIPIPEELLEILKFTDQNSDRIWDFSRTTGWRVISNKMKDADISGVKATPKDLRHSFAVAYIENEVSITIVQRWLGHRNLETTAIYLNTFGKEDRNLARRAWY